MDIVKNLFKWLVTGLITVATLFAVGIMYLTFSIDVNSYKPKIESLAQKQGWDITIDGDIAWKVFPKLGLSVADISFSDNKVIAGSAESLTLATDWNQLLSFNKPFDEFQLSSLRLESGSILWTAANALPVQLNNVQLVTRHLSLLGQRFPLSVSASVLGGHQLKLQTDVALNLNDQNIENLSLSNLQFMLDDMMISGQLSANHNASFVQGNLTSSTINLRQLIKTIQPLAPLLAVPDTVAPDALSKFNVQTSFSLDTGAASHFVSKLTLDDQLFDVDVSIDHPRDNLITLVSGDLLRVADYLPKTTDSANSSLFAPLAIPFALWQGRSQVEINLGRVEMSDFSVKNFYSNIFGNQRVLRMTSLNADVFDGQINAIGKLDMRSAQPSFSLQPSVYNIDLNQAMKALAGNTELSGTLNLEANIQSAGQDIGQLVKSLTGAGQFGIQKPIYRTINLEQTFCNAATLLSGKPQSGQTWPQGTELSDLQGNFQFSDGQLLVKDYSTGTGNLDIMGRGTVDLIKRQYRVNASARVDQPVTSAAGCNINKRLQNRQLPFVCEGQFDSDASSGPSCKPDERIIRDLLKDSALDRLLDRSGLKQQDSTDQVKSLIKDLLKR